MNYRLTVLQSIKRMRLKENQKKYGFKKCDALSFVCHNFEGMPESKISFHIKYCTHLINSLLKYHIVIHNSESQVFWNHLGK